MSKYLTLFFVFCAITITANAVDFQPLALTKSLRPSSEIDRRIMSAVDVAKLKAEDVVRESRGLAPRFATPIPVKLNPNNSGTWERVDSSTSIWRLRIISRGALSLNLGFTKYKMPAGGRLLLYPTDDRGIEPGKIRTFTDADNERHHQLWTPVVFSDDIMVELVLPTAKRGELRLQLTSVGHDYRGFGRFRDDAMKLAGTSGSCNVDVVCPQGNPYSNQIRSVGVYSLGGGLFCTGSLVNNTAQDRKMYFLTANHCGVGSGNAASIVVYWNYQNSFCRPPGSAASGSDGDGTLNQFQTGAFYRAGYTKSDFTLVELDDPPSAGFNIFWAGWDRSTGDFTSAEGIHHPNTAEKRISLSNTSTTTTSWGKPRIPGDGTHLHVFWVPGIGVTEPGSSGSPLYSPQGRYIGQLHGGPSSCTASDKSDYYGRFSVSWDKSNKASQRLREWLDPGITNVVTLDGITQ